MKKFSPKLFLLLAGFSIFTSGCSSFNRDWEKAETLSFQTGLAGRWEGTWSSDQNGHSGALRCLIEPINQESYRARFDSTYKQVLHFKSTVLLNGRMTNDVFRFQGEAKLPWWAGGIYNYDGGVTKNNFFSTYKNKYDHGTFQMTRPLPGM
jgi:hypothetical protein